MGSRKPLLSALEPLFTDIVGSYRDFSAHGETDDELSVMS